MDTLQTSTPTTSATPASPPVQKSTNGTMIAAIVFGIIALVFAGTTFFFLDKATAAEARVATLEQEKKDLEKKLDTAEALKDDVEAAQATSAYIADKLDELETILLDTDSNSVDFITWAFENAYFDDVDLAQAKYDAWEAEQYRTNDAYDSWKADIEFYFGEDTTEPGSSI